MTYDYDVKIGFTIFSGKNDFSVFELKIAYHMTFSKYLYPSHLFKILIQDMWFLPIRGSILV